MALVLVALPQRSSGAPGGGPRGAPESGRTTGPLPDWKARMARESHRRISHHVGRRHVRFGIVRRSGALDHADAGGEAIRARLTLAGVSALAALALAACGVAPAAGPTNGTQTPTPAPLRPGEITPQPAPEHLRWEVGDGVVAASDEYDGARAAYVTHVPTGAQVVIGGDGGERERHQGSGGGLARIDAALADDDTRARVIGMATGELDPRNGIIDWVPFVKFNGITYVSAWRSPSPMPESPGNLRYRVAFRLDGHVGARYRSQDGDAGWLAPGTPLYEVRGYDPSFRLATLANGEVRLYEAGTNPAAEVGADLLDIRGKVTAIDVLSERDAETVLASIDDGRTVESAVEMVLGAPVDQGRRDRDGERYFLGFRLADGTSVVRSFWLESGEVSRGIMTDAWLAMLVLGTLPEDFRPEQRSAGPGIKKTLAMRLGVAGLRFGGAELAQVSEPHSPLARLMRLSQYVALTGASLGDVPDPMVWVIEARGEWRDAGIVSEDKRTTYAYGAVAIDAETGSIHGSTHRHTPLLGGRGDAPLVTPTPTLRPTPTEVR